MSQLILSTLLYVSYHCTHLKDKKTEVEGNKVTPPSSHHYKPKPQALGLELGMDSRLNPFFFLLHCIYLPKKFLRKLIVKGKGQEKN